MADLIQHPEIKKILEHYKSIWALKHAISLGVWDLETYIPQEGVAARSEALSKLTSVSQKLFLEPSFVALITQAATLHPLNEYERAIIRVLLRELKFYQRLPSDFIEEFVRVTSEATTIWRKAKEEGNFSLFEPTLNKIVQLVRKKATYLGYVHHPYDALLDEYEEGLTVNEVERYFESIKGPLKTLLHKILAVKTYQQEHALEHEGYEQDKMHSFNQKLLTLLQGKLTHLRLDVSAHPFSTSMGKGDARVTTRYDAKDFARTYSSTMHEYGHALYEIQSHDDLHYTPIAGGLSLVIHESQSRFWENFVGRSKEFLSLIYPELIHAQPSLQRYSIEQLYQHLNRVKPSLIRTEADEVTYHFHILIRFEIEKGLIEGKIHIKDLPAIWNKKYKEYLGVDVPTDAQGVLQDIHWSQGSFGYFPTYSLGTALSALWKEHLEQQQGTLSSLLASTEGITVIKEFLRTTIHRYGSTYTFRELVKKTTTHDFSAQPLLRYLQNKYETISSDAA